MKCPKCGGRVSLIPMSSGGDDMLIFLNCRWVEDFCMKESDK